MYTTQSRIFLSPPHLTGHEQQYITEAFRDNWVAPVGPNIDAFEKEVAGFIGASDAVAVSSGTAAIHLALCLLNIHKGDIVFCSTLTFVASANPILYQGAEPVFIDSEPETWCMSPQALERALHNAKIEGKLPKAVIVVNLYGQVAKMNEIIELCNLYQVPLIEDAAESLGSFYKNKASGNFGEFSIFSFNGNKIITTSGGGMLICRNPETAEKARFFATQAKDQAIHYQHSKLGFNYRMSNILAGIGRAQLAAINDRVEARRRIFRKYFEELAKIPGIEFMPELENTRTNRWLTTITIDEKESGLSTSTLQNALAEENIESRPVWKPLHIQPLFKGAKYFPHHDEHSVSEQLFHSGLCLPSGSNLGKDEQNRVINIIKNKLKIIAK